MKRNKQPYSLMILMRVYPHLIHIEFAMQKTTMNGPQRPRLRETATKTVNVIQLATESFNCRSV